MANSLEQQIVSEGPRNVVVKLTGILDTSDITQLPAININSFTTNEPRTMGVLSGFRVDSVEWSMSKDLEVQLFWDSNAPQQILPLAGRGEMCATHYGGLQPNQTRSGYSGNINLITNGYVGGTVQNFSIILELIKLYRNT